MNSVYLLLLILPAVADEPAVPKEVAALVGAYTGEWTMFGIDDKGEVVKKMAWTDVMKGEKPEVKDGRAFVSTTDEMKFEGGGSFKVQGKEGYLLTKDGKLGDYYTEMMGQTHRLVKLSDTVSTYVAKAAGPELAQLGFPATASGQHVLVKVVTQEGGAETHRISRVTTVTWKDKDGKERVLQYVSLQGFHKRQP